MRLRHAILLIMLGGAAGIMCVWHNTRLVDIERRITEIKLETESIECELQNVDVELANLRRIENLEILAENCGITDYLRPPVLPDNS